MRVDPNSRLTLLFILLTVFIDMVGLGIIIPVLPDLIVSLTGETVTDAAKTGGYLVFVYAAMQFLFSPVLGNLSDRFGRRPVLLLSLVGLTVDYMIMGLAPSLGWLFFGRFLSGVCGAALGTATAYIADITPKHKRSERFGLIFSAFGLGFIVGPVIGGELGEFGPRAPFFAAAALTFANVIFGFFVLPESLSKRKRRRFNIKRANPFGAIMQFRKNPVVLALLSTLFLFALAAQTYPNVWSFFTIEQFGWGPSQVGRSLGVFGILFAFSQAILIRWMMKSVGPAITILVGMAIATTALIGVSFIHTEIGLWGFMIVGALAGMAIPALTGLISNSVADNAQGEVQGAVNATNSLTTLISPIAATQLFSFFTSQAAPTQFPGAPFFAAGVLVMCSAAVFVFAVVRFKLMGRHYDEGRKKVQMTPPSGNAVNPPDPDDPDREDDEETEQSDAEETSRPQEGGA